MSKKMYALIDTTWFKAGVVPKTEVPNFPKKFQADGTTIIPYTGEATINITQMFNHEQNHYTTRIKIYWTEYDTHASHVGRQGCI